MRERGHRVTIATSEIYRAKVEGEGLGFYPLRPDISFMLDEPEVMRLAFHPRTGGAYLFRKLIAPFLEQSYEDTLVAVADADLIVGHVIAFTTRTVADVLEKPWISVALQPAVFLSAHDPSSISGAPWLDHLHQLGPRFWGPVHRILKRAARPFGKRINVLRVQAGLMPLKNPLFDSMVSPLGMQAWFSSVFAVRQPDWHEPTLITGFPFYDRLVPGEGMGSALRDFLDSGPAPVVFTLGSAAVMSAGSFYTESLEAVRQLGCRAVLLIGSDVRNLPAGAVPATVHIAQYAPYSELFARAAALVHQGGMGTTAQALRSGKPMLVVPWSHDQPDNGLRITRLGVGEVIPRSKYKAARVAAGLRRLLAEPEYAEAAGRVARGIAAEDGVGAACDGLEATLAAVTKSGA